MKTKTFHRVSCVLLAAAITSSVSIVYILGSQIQRKSTLHYQGLEMNLLSMQGNHFLSKVPQSSLITDADSVQVRNVFKTGDSLKVSQETKNDNVLKGFTRTEVSVSDESKSPTESNNVSEGSYNVTNNTSFTYFKTGDSLEVSQETKNDNVLKGFTRTEVSVSDESKSPTESNNVSEGSYNVTNNTSYRTKRQNLLIFGHDRSGTTFTTQIFNQDSRFFTLYEPLWETAAWMNENTSLNGKQLTLDLLKNFMNCSFDDNDIGKKFLQDFSHAWRRRRACRVLFSPPFCNGSDKTSCVEIQPRVLDEHCKNRYLSTVVKIATIRTPGHALSSVVKLLDENSAFDVKILHVVRDPRGSINSRINARWIPDFSYSIFVPAVYRICSTVYRNIMTGVEISKKFPGKYQLFLYEDLANDPISTARKMYRYLGFEMPLETEEWIVTKTQPPAEELKTTLKNPFSITRNATGNADRWRKESPSERVRVIEEICQPVLKFLGFKNVVLEPIG